MYYFAIAALVFGLLLLVIGYRKNSRNMLAAAAFLLLASGGAEDFVAGFQGELKSSDQSAQVTEG